MNRQRITEALRVAVLGILAGIAIGLGGYSNIVAKAYLENWGSVVGSFTFTFGMFLVCVLGFYLYTGKIGFVIDKAKDRFLNLALMLAGNALGAIGLGYLLSLIISSSAKEVALNIAEAKFASDGWNSCYRLFLSAMMCGMLVFLAVYIYKNSQSVLLKIAGLSFPIFIFVLCGFDHVIANFFYFSVAKAWNGEALINIIYVLIGNSLGSIILYLAFKFARIRISN